MIPLVAAAVYVINTPLARADIEIEFHKDQLQNRNNVLVIIPILTANAYSKHGFYDYYEGKCGIECLTMPINQGVKLQEQSSANTIHMLKKLGYGFENDYIIDYYLQANPRYLDQFDGIVVLHSEYVTQKIFDALQAHKKVIYLAPNALYAEVEINKGVMTLKKGHGYVTDDNVFGWKYENTHPYEFVKDNCGIDKFRKTDNGYQLMCNPETTMYKNFDVLKTLNILLSQ